MSTDNRQNNQNTPNTPNSGQTIRHHDGYTKRDYFGAGRTTGSTPSKPPVRKPRSGGE